MAGHQIRSLRSVIDAGQSPLDYMPPKADEPDHQIEILGDMLTTAIGDRDSRERALEEGAERREVFQQVRPMNLDRTMHREEWEEELLRDPALVDRVVAAIPDPFDRARLSMRVDVARCGYPIEVDVTTGTWQCDGCGGCFEAGHPTLWIGNREGSTDEPNDNGYTPSWCVSCFEDALERAKRLSAHGQEVTG